MMGGRPIRRELAESVGDRAPVQSDERADKQPKPVTQLLGAGELRLVAHTSPEQHVGELVKVGWRERQPASRSSTST
jgi:hypothetical protein